MIRGSAALEKICDQWQERHWHPKVLDIGSGDGTHAKAFKAMRCQPFVTTIDLGDKADITEDYMLKQFHIRPFELIWCCHVLEHQPDVGAFLRKIYRELTNGGLLAITVPPAKHEIVGGHVSIWNQGLLVYNLILAGFDCSLASVWQYGYNISAVVRKKPAEPEGLVMDCGDIERIAKYFPLPFKHGDDGRFNVHHPL